MTRAKRKSAAPRHTTPWQSRTSPSPGVCPDCKRAVLFALFDATPRCWDPAPLSEDGEFEAHLRGLKTWWLFGGNVTYRRNAYAIQTSPSGRGGSIVRDHDCVAPEASGRALRAPVVHSDVPGF